MLKYLMICEKPSLMKAVKACYYNHRTELNNKIGEIDFIALSGHVCANAYPNEYSEYADVKWKDIDYPIIPTSWKISAINDSRKRKTLKAIKDNIDDYDGIIVGTDSDVEGYGIYYLLENYLGLTSKPALRFMEHSLTDTEILKSLLDMTDYHTDPRHINYTKSYLLRSRADWLYGMNATMYASVKAGQTLAIGRVKAPTIKLVYDNSMAIDNFVPKTTFQEIAKYENFEGVLIDKKNKAVQVDDKKSLPQWPKKEGKVVSVTSTKQNTHAPKLYDLAALQIEAGSKFGFSPAKTLSIVQSLYEVHKVISYPRTQCRYVSAEKAKEFPQMLKQAAVFSELDEALKSIDDSDILQIYNDKSVVNDKEVNKESHDALLPTNKTPDLSQLSADEKKICLMIYRRMVAQFLPKYITNNTNVIIEHDKYQFLAKGQTIENQGWKILYKTENDKELPPLKVGDFVECSEFRIKDAVSKPPKRLTEATLIKSMEHIGELIEDKELKKSLMDSKGIGTSATRATLISDIIKRGYVEKKKDGLHITNIGKAYINNIKDIGIADPVFAALIDMDIKKIQRGELDFDTAYAITLDKLHDICRKIGESEMLNAKMQIEETDIACPHCGENIKKDKYYYKCGCENFKVQRYICGVEISDKDLNKMLNGKTTAQKTFTKKDGTKFKGRLEIKDGAIAFNFSSGLKCPVCGKDLTLNKGGAFCECGFKLFRKMCGREFTDKEITTLINKKRLNDLEGFKSKSGNMFNADVILTEDGLAFDFDNY